MGLPFQLCFSFHCPGMSSYVQVPAMHSPKLPLPAAQSRGKQLLPVIPPVPCLCHEGRNPAGVRDEDSVGRIDGEVAERSWRAHKRAHGSTGRQREMMKSDHHTRAASICPALLRDARSASAPPSLLPTAGPSRPIIYPVSQSHLEKRVPMCLESCKGRDITADFLWLCT